MIGFAQALDALPGRRFDWPRWRWFWREVADCIERQIMWNLTESRRREGDFLAGISAFTTILLPFDQDAQGRDCCASCTARLKFYQLTQPDPETGHPERYVQYVCPMGCEYPMPPGRPVQSAREVA